VTTHEPDAPIPTSSDPANPYVAPTARLVDYAPADHASRLRGEPRVVGAGAASQWITTGWSMFRDDPGTWIAIVLVYFAIIVVVSVVPILSMVNGLLSPVLAAGVIFACEAQHKGSGPSVAHLFEGFRTRLGPLTMIGVLYLVGLLTVVAIVGASMAIAIPLLALGDLRAAATPAAMVAMVLAGLLALALFIPLSFTIWWSPALVAVHGLAPADAMRRSMRACLRNWRALLVYGVLLAALFLVALIPFGLGLLVAGPVFGISWWAGYRDIFVE
jgi:uncharacterized membrane protein